MLEIPGLNGIKKILWKNISSGMVIIGGLKINNGFPIELLNYPTLTPILIETLTHKYKLLPNREIIVAEAIPGASVSKMAGAIRMAERKISSVNKFRNHFASEKNRIIAEHDLVLNISQPILLSRGVNQDFLIKDTFNSFQSKLISTGIPSIFNRLEEAISLADVFSGRLKEKINLPEDKEVLLHLVIDYSYSMNSAGKLDRILATVHNFYRDLTEFILNLKVLVYVFSDTCAQVKYPLSGREIERRETNYASFMKKVLHHNQKDVHNKVILFTDGEPSDLEEALLNGNRMKKQNIDYTQIVFSIGEEKRHIIQGDASRYKSIDGYLPEGIKAETRYLNDLEWKEAKDKSYGNFMKVAEACGGNLIILDIYDFLNLVSIEVYDRYMGQLTLSKSTDLKDAVLAEFQQKAKVPGFVTKDNKIAKPFQFKKLER
ncbi:VWA domain-containing protein [Leptospira ognonensis]|uniref:VWA domain-containing protein n=1 Tax=Leptospira ognonensis TaxID=2484945 RepID=A0A4R9K138_9LEPT|nr:vWA domain-containing protein [Leptospira ognonensis]TGL59389.1 VWA domain-containing protein [Leptospira ognonensis]